MTPADFRITLFSVGSAVVFAVFLHGCADEAAMFGALLLEARLRMAGGAVIVLAVASSVWANRARARERARAQQAGRRDEVQNLFDALHRGHTD